MNQITTADEIAIAAALRADLRDGLLDQAKRPDAEAPTGRRHGATRAPARSVRAELST
jgi:hypothetical protein